MKNPMYLIPVLLIASFFWGAITTRSMKLSLDDGIITDTNQIQETIQAYFDLRYRSHNTLQLEDFSPLVDNNYGDAFLQSETDKLSIELRHAQIYQLRYVEYNFSLDFTEISIDTTTQTATASVIEGHDVVFEIVAKITGETIYSSMRNQEHVITLRKVDGVWKIVFDDYEDYLWRFLNATGISMDEFLSSMNIINELPITPSSPNGPTGNCYFSPDESSHVYDRSSAVDYAHVWATAAPLYNPDYYDFSSEGGDCTNFVSQAIHEGGGGLMVGANTEGWYYNSVSDYASAWTGVNFFYRFLVPDYDKWSAGPEGCSVDKDDAEIGDVIQYDWENDGDWDHSVIIVFSVDMGYGDMDHLVAAHTDDVDNYPFLSYFYTYDDMVYRFLHIDRIDGYYTYLALVQQNSGTYQVEQNLGPYPAPAVTFDDQQISQPNPYPSP